jgi:DNA polymerase-3 subunit gamma/tau
MEGRHVDVMEMDAASNTGVNDVREIIDSVHYRAASARYKIYIIDEVHMLSNSAFNALLKTLEEPPAHVKFIFATTEIRKVPVTVLSRCQRFDLRRIEPELMIGLLRKIATSEAAEITDDALALITRAAEGSARDATSLLDQAISHGAGETTADQVRAMLGLADRGRVMDLFERIMRGDAAGALEELSAQYADGADPLAVLRDLAELTHWISVVKITPEAAEDPTISPDERGRGLSYADGLGMRPLSRAWQMLLKAIEEVANAPSSMMAAEMAIIRLTHVAELPSPEELVRKLQETPTPPAGGPAPTGPSSGPGSSFAQNTQTSAMGQAPAPTHPGPSGPVASLGGARVAVAQATDQALARYPSFEHVLELIRTNRDVKLLVEVEASVRLAAYQPGRIEFTPTDNAAPDLAARLGTALQRWTGNRWAVTLVNGCEAETIVEKRDAAKLALEAEAHEHPMVQAVIASFPKARIEKIHTPEEAAVQAQEEALQEVEDEWDPFEEE